MQPATMIPGSVALITITPNQAVKNYIGNTNAEFFQRECWYTFE
jgi:hypothetical protein